MKPIKLLGTLGLLAIALTSCEINIGGKTTSSTSVNPTPVVTNPTGSIISTTDTKPVVSTQAPVVSTPVETTPIVSTPVQSTVAPTTPIESSTNPVTTTKPLFDELTLSVLAMNDVHGYIEQDNNGRGGISNAAYKINSIRNEDDYDNTLLIANGDMFQGTGLVRMSQGEVMVDVMNEMGFDACAIGNHEFDWYLSTITNYFDGYELNGEADFPLLNANIIDNSTGKLVSIDNEIMSSTIIDKEGVKVGVIGYIGDVAGSICYNMVKDYTFDTNFEQLVYDEGTKLKNQGCDVIVVSIHDGNADGVEYYQPNLDIANLKYNGQYLVDAVINGHTHTKQMGNISRDGGVAMPVIQSSGNLGCFSRIDLTIDMNTKKVVSTASSHVTTSSLSSYDAKVESIVDAYYEQSKDTLEEVYCQTSYLSRYSTDLRNWAANVMMGATGADAAICNTGGLRSNVEAGSFTFEKLYSLNPFDNHIILCEITGSKLKAFMDANANYEFCNTVDGDYTNVVRTKTYKLAIIDYVYYSYYFSNYRPNTETDTNLILRDIMAIDLRLHTTFNPSSDSSAYLSQIYFG